MINVRDASSSRYKWLSLPFRVGRDIVADGTGNPLSGLGKE